MFLILLESIYIQSLTIGLILLYIYFQLTKRQIKLNEPPLVYYRFPIIGHTWSFLTDCERLNLESREKYGETFSLYIFGKVMTIVGKDTVQEVFNKVHDFDFAEGVNEILHLKEIFPHTWGMGQSTADKSVKIVHDTMRLMDNFTSRMQKNVNKTIEIYIGECAEPKVIHNFDEISLNIISILAANVVIGEDCHYHNDLIKTFKYFNNSVVQTTFIPKQIASISPMFVSKHKDIIISHIRPVIKKRLEDKKKLGDAWVAPLDVLQLCLDDPEIAPDLDPNNVNYNFIFDVIGSFIFASTSTTAIRTFYALCELAVRKEYWNELYQEAQEINNQCNDNRLKSEDLDKMVKLDKFIKESFRLNNDIFSSPHLCVSKSHYTFENGYQVPAGRFIFVNLRNLSSDEELQGQDPKKFYAYRHNSPATKLEHNHLVFGSGRRACPGRFLAVNAIKIILHTIILKYNIRIKNVQIVPRKFSGAAISPSIVDIEFENSEQSMQA